MRTELTDMAEYYSLVETSERYWSRDEWMRFSRNYLSKQHFHGLTIKGKPFINLQWPCNEVSGEINAR